MGEIITYTNEGPKGTYCQIKLDSGERILISIAQPGIRIYKLILGGLVPRGTIWECGIDDVSKAIEIFGDPENPTAHPLDAIKDKLINCKSIEDVKSLIHNFSSKAREDQ